MEEKGETRRYEHRGDNLSRLISLTDGICAAALTLLVLTLDIPEIKGATSEPTLWQGIRDVYPQLLSNFLTFLVVGSYWMAHHWAFEYIVRYDRRLLWFNLMFLLCIGLLPFTTDLLGEHSTSRVVWGVYAVHMVVTGLTFTGLWGYVASSDMLDARIHARQVRYMILPLSGRPLRLRPVHRHRDFIAGCCLFLAAAHPRRPPGHSPRLLPAGNGAKGCGASATAGDLHLAGLRLPARAGFLGLDAVRGVVLRAGVKLARSIRHQGCVRNLWRTWVA